MNFINSLKEIDTQLFLFLNSKHNSFFDVVMYWASNKFFWIPLYALFLFLAFKHFSRQIGLIILCAILLIVFADQISVHAFKNIFLRYRPCHNLLIQSQVHLVDGCGGTYGFISSHAANVFALAMFLGLLFKDKINYFMSLIFLWAIFVSYSRIYNGVHYPADVTVGAIIGMGVGIVIFKFYSFMNRKYYNGQ